MTPTDRTLQHWLDEELEGCAAQPEAARGYLAWSLRVMRNDHGTGLMMRHVPHRQLSGTVLIVPERQQRKMPKQVFGELPPLLRVSFWRRSWRGLREIFQQAVRILCGQ